MHFSNALIPEYPLPRCVSLVKGDGYYKPNCSAKVARNGLVKSVGRDCTQIVYSTISDVLQITVLSRSLVKFEVINRKCKLK